MFITVPPQSYLQKLQSLHFIWVRTDNTYQTRHGFIGLLLNVVALEGFGMKTMEDTKNTVNQETAC